jgi:hypothetical protein
MARHFAKCTGERSNPLTVIKVIVAEPEFFDNFVDDSPGRWIETKKGMYGGILYNSDGTVADNQSQGFRFNYAGPGMVYDVINDVFYDKKPYNSWILNTSTYIWEPPISRPSKTHRWNEEKYQDALINNSDTSVAWESTI